MIPSCRWFVLVVVVIQVVTGTSWESQQDSEAPPDRVLVATHDGPISGVRTSSVSGKTFYSYWSIPYAKPPVGPLRLKAPQAGDGWTEVRDGSVVPPLCSQIPFISMVSRNITYVGTEDCLFLNVFTPKPNDVDAGLPVLVFIHGGGLVAGGTKYQPPQPIMEKNLVFVTMQYRLGMLGFFSSDDSIIPGNYGLKDQIMALRWIQKNIHKFGGDPDQVTLIGLSAGAKSVHFHYLSPYSQGLFKRGIMQSGSLLVPSAIGGSFRETAEFTRRLFGCPETQGATSGEASRTLLHCLQNINVEDLVMSLENHISINFHPSNLAVRVDYDYLPGPPEVLMLQGRHKMADTILGVNRDEGALFTLPLFADNYDFMKTALNDNFPKYGPDSLEIRDEDVDPEHLAQEIFHHYTGQTFVSDEKADQLCQMYGERQYIFPHLLCGRLHARNTPPTADRTFMYNFTHRGLEGYGDNYSSRIGKHWVSHGSDYCCFLQRQKTEEDLHMQSIMTEMMYNFIKTGNPTPDSSLGFTWEPATPDNLQHLNINAQPFMQPHTTARQIMKFWESLPTRQNQVLNPDKVVDLTPAHTDYNKARHNHRKSHTNQDFHTEL